MKFRIYPVGLAFLSAVILGAGCKKKQETVGAPALAAPDKVFSAGSQSEGQDNVPAEAEVKASSGPVELTLRVHKKIVKNGKDVLWTQILLRNIGEKKFLVFDDSFLYPGYIDAHGSYGLTLQIIDRNGDRQDCAPMMSHSSGWPEPSSDSKDPEGDSKKIVEIMSAEGEKIREREALRAELDKQSVSKKELFRRLSEFDTQHAHIGLQQRPVSKKSLLIESGASVSTLPWAKGGERFPRPAGNYFECWGSQFWEPGKYRVRGSYDNRPDGDTIRYNQKHHLRAADDEVLVQTPYVEVMVLP